MEKIYLIVLPFLLFFSPVSVFGQNNDQDDESRYNIVDDTIRVSAKAFPSLKFMGEVQDAVPQSKDYSVHSSGNRVDVIVSSSNPVHYTTMYVNEGPQSGFRQHTFIIEFVRELSLAEQTHDYSTKEKLKARIAYLENAKKSPHHSTDDSYSSPAVNEGTDVRTNGHNNNSIQYPSAGVISSRNITSENEIRDLPKEKVEARVNQRIQAFYTTTTALCDRRGNINTNIAYGMKLFNNDEGVIVERYSAKTRQHQTTKIKSYFKALTQLNYASVEMTARNINFVSKFTLGRDGKWHGTAVVLQDFVGYNDKVKAYIDQTNKSIDIIIEVNEVIRDGKVINVFEVFLGNISVNDITN